MSTLRWLGLGLCVAFVGCGAAPPGCKVTGLTVDINPGSGATVLDHTAKAPGNQQQFLAYPQTVETGDCVEPAILAPATATWTVSDAVHVQISSATDSTNGLATCVGATSGPVTVTATVMDQGFTATGSSNITCK